PSTLCTMSLGGYKPTSLCSEPAVAVLKSASIDGSKRSKLFEAAITVFREHQLPYQRNAQEYALFRALTQSGGCKTVLTASEGNPYTENQPAPPPRVAPDPHEVRTCLWKITS